MAIEKDLFDQLLAGRNDLKKRGIDSVRLPVDDVEVVIGELSHCFLALPLNCYQLLSIFHLLLW